MMLGKHLYHPFDIREPGPNPASLLPQSLRVTSPQFGMVLSLFNGYPVFGGRGVPSFPGPDFVFITNGINPLPA